MKHLIAIAVILVIALFMWLVPPEKADTEVKIGKQESDLLLKNGNDKL